MGTEVSFKTKKIGDKDEQKLIRFTFNDQSGKPTLDYYVADEIQLRGVTSVVEKDGSIEVAATANDNEGEAKLESVTPALPEDVQRVLALARKAGILPRLFTDWSLHLTALRKWLANVAPLWLGWLAPRKSRWLAKVVYDENAWDNMVKKDLRGNKQKADSEAVHLDLDIEDKRPKFLNFLVIAYEPRFFFFEFF